MPFNTVFSSTRLICWASFSDLSQQASSSTVSCLYRATLLTKELALTSMGWIILLYRAHSLRHHALKDGNLCFIVLAPCDQTCSPQATWSQPHTGRSSTNLPHRENTVYHVITLGASGTMLPCLHCNSPCSIGARGVVVIAVGNEHGDTSSNPGWDWLHFT